MAKTSTEPRPKDFAVRILRVKTWLGRAERALKSENGMGESEGMGGSEGIGEKRRGRGDPDVAFILYWIAFNAAYARDLSPKNPNALKDMKQFFQNLLDVDRGYAIRDALWSHCHDQVYALVDIQYLFMPYWVHANAESRDIPWEGSFHKDKVFVRDALRNNCYERIRKVLRIVFSRLYVLRNQLVHGGAQFESHYNRDSIFDGAHIMATLVPVFLDLMDASHGMDWGQPFFRPALKGHATPSITRHPLYRDRFGFP